MKARRPINLDATRKAIRKGRPVFLPDVDVTVCTVHGRSLCFASDRVKDPIQRSHRGGEFYEGPELKLIRAHFPQGGTFVDIGANVGNHSLYVAAFLQPAKVIPFEPNPPAYKLLLANIALNNFAPVFDMRFIGMGVSDTKADDFGMSPRDTNLGGAQMVAGAGDIQTIQGDAALLRDTPDFIKIDVEGMELQVLAGLAETIARTQPTILIEIDTAHDADFRAWCDANDYEVLQAVQRYQANRNYLIRPKAARVTQIIDETETPAKAVA